MRLEHICDMELAEPPADALAQPERSEAEAGTVKNGGIASGEQLYGTVQWVQPPQWPIQAGQLADMHAVLTTEEGVQIHCALHGRPVERPSAPGGPDRVLFLARFGVEDARYQWLTNALCLAEGLLFPASQRVQLRLYACVQELGAQGPS